MMVYLFRYTEHEEGVKMKELFEDTKENFWKLLTI